MKDAVLEVIDCCFRSPQRVLSDRGSTDPKKKQSLDWVTVLATRLLSARPQRGPTMLMDPIVVRVGFRWPWKRLAGATPDELRRVRDELRGLDEQVGTWSLVQDVRDVSGERPNWRIAAEFRPLAVQNMAWLNAGSPVLCVDIAGAGVFIGGRRKKKPAAK